MKKMNKKTLVLLIAIAALMTASIGGTVAWLATSSGPITNTFLPTKAVVTVNDEIVNNVTKQNVVITNNSDFPGYIRAAIVANWYKDGQIVAPWKNTAEEGTFEGLTGNGWEEIGGYYYYLSPVDAGEATGSALFKSYTVGIPPVDGAHLEMDIIAQVIQATPKQAVIDAWGQTVADQLNDQQN